MTSLIAREGDWEIRKTPCGKVYFLNEKLGADQWAVPEELAKLGYTETGPPPCQTGGACALSAGADASASSSTAATVAATAATTATTTTAASTVKVNMVDDF